MLATKNLEYPKIGQLVLEMADEAFSHGTPIEVSDGVRRHEETGVDSDKVALWMNRYLQTQDDDCLNRALEEAYLERLVRVDDQKETNNGAQMPQLTLF